MNFVVFSVYLHQIVHVTPDYALQGTLDPQDHLL